MISTGDVTADRLLALRHAPIDLRTKRHEAAHVAAGWIVLGPDTLDGVTVVRDGKYLGQTHLTIDLERFDYRNQALVATDAAVIITAAVKVDPGNDTPELNADDDTAKLRGLGAIAFRQLAKPGDAFADWYEAWLAQVNRRVWELLDSDYFWKCVYAVESAMDQLPTISGDGLRAILSKVS